MKKILIALTLALLFVVPVSAKSDKAKEPAPKFDICHFDGNDSYHIINVSENAIPAHMEHGDILTGAASEPVSDMDEGYYYTDTCEYAFIRSAEISSPTKGEEYFVGDLVDFTATLIDKDKDDNVQWAVRKGICAAGQGTVWGNVDSHNDPYTWVGGMTFSSTADTTGWDEGMYCFVFNPTESLGDTAIRETREFSLNLREPVFIETVLIDPSDVDGESSLLPLTLGNNYIFQVTGTFSNRNGREYLDAEYVTEDNWITKFDGLSGWPLNDYWNELDLMVDSNFVDWMELNPQVQNTYSLNYVGSGNSVNFMVFDGSPDTKIINPAWYTDNIGQLTVDIYRQD